MSRSGYIGTSDFVDVSNASSSNYIDSTYNGTHRIFNTSIGSLHLIYH